MTDIYESLSGHWLSDFDWSFVSNPPLEEPEEGGPNYTDFWPCAAVSEFQLNSDRTLSGKLWRNEGWNFTRQSEFVGTWSITRRRLGGPLNGRIVIPFYMPPTPEGAQPDPANHLFDVEMALFVYSLTEIHFLHMSFDYKKPFEAGMPHAPLAHGVMRKRDEFPGIAVTPTTIDPATNRVTDPGRVNF